MLLEYRECACKQCGEKFFSRASRAYYCGNACKQRFRRATGMNNVLAVCQRCHHAFVKDRWARKRFCNQYCASVKTPSVGDKMKLTADWVVTMKTVSELNCNKHFRIKSARHRLQKKIINAKWFSFPERPKVSLPCHVILTRMSPRFLDVGDNLPASMKYIRDALGELINPGSRAGQGDGNDSGIKWEYDQVKSSKQQVRIQIFCE